MSRSSAQPATVTMAVAQTVTIEDPVERHSYAQAVEVTMGTGYIYVDCKPAQKLPQE